MAALERRPSVRHMGGHEAQNKHRQRTPRCPSTGPWPAARTGHGRPTKQRKQTILKRGTRSAMGGVGSTRPRPHRKGHPAAL